MTNTTKMIVLLGGHDRVLRHIDRQKNAGVFYLVIEDSSKRGSFDESVVDHVLYYDDCASNPQIQLDLLHFQRTYRICRIITVSEKYLSITAALRHALLSDTSAQLLTERLKDKHKMRAVLKTHELCDLPSGTVETESDLWQFVNQHGTSILKPRYGVGSQSVYKLTASTLPKTHWPSILEDTPFVCEQFIPGKEYSVETLSVQGVHSIIGITQKLIDEHFVEKGHIFPADLPQHWEQAIHDYILLVLNAFAFHDAPGHFEVKVTEVEGHVTVRLIEGHNRTGGDWITDLILLSTGYNIYQELFSLSPTLPDQSKPSERYGIAFFTLYAPPTEHFETTWQTLICHEKERYQPEIYDPSVPASSFARSGHILLAINHERELLTVLNKLTNKVTS